MKKLLAMLVFAGFLFAAAPAALRAQDDDHGRHRGWYKHGDDDDDQGDRHDNGWHKGWYKHHDRDDWDDDGGAFATTIRVAVTRMSATSLLSAASIRARGISFCTTIPIGSSRPTTFLAAATGNGIATASMSMTTTAILAGTCSSILDSAAPFTSFFGM